MPPGRGRVAGVEAAGKPERAVAGAGIRMERKAVAAGAAVPDLSGRKKVAGPCL